MNIDDGRYTYVRNRLIELFNIINNRTFSFWITPQSMMTLDEIRDRDTYRGSDIIGDPHYFETAQLRKLRIPQVLSFLPTMGSYQDLGYADANYAVPEIYESIQDYLSLWCELMTHMPHLKSPHMSELRLLEGMAFFVFPHYKKIKPYRRVLEDRRFSEDKALEARGLAGFAMLFSRYSMGSEKGVDEISFVSHLDHYESSKRVETYLSSNSSGRSWEMPRDSIADIAKNQNYDPSWAFKG